MGDRVKVFLREIASFWGSLSTPKRIALVASTLLVLGGVLLVANLSNRINYAFLYTELEPDDAGAIVEKLKSMQVPYRLERGGTAIQVPEEQVANTRLELAANGLPRGGSVGFEIFDQTRIGATEFEQQINLRRALEGELSRSISAIEGVKSARVHLVMPERRLFATTEEGASASVVVRLENGRTFDRREIQAVVHLVASAVPGLSKDRVSLVSTEGVTLHRPATDTGAGALSDGLSEQSRLVAAQLEAEARSQLERVVGPGNADIRVSVELDSARRERTEELYDPKETALRSEQETEELSGTAELSVAGVPGAVSNLPDAAGEAAAAGPAGAGGKVLRRSHTRNWEVERITEKTSTPPGQVRRISVAVLLNGKWEPRGGKEVFVPRAQDEVAALTDVVKRAVGFDTQRGDAIEVRAMRFTRSDAGDGATPPAAPVWVKWWPAAAALAALAVLALVVLVWRGKKKPSVVPLELRSIAASLAPEALAGARDLTPALPAGPDMNELRNRAMESAAKDPATAAVVLRQWLHADPTQPPSRT